MKCMLLAWSSPPNPVLPTPVAILSQVDIALLFSHKFAACFDSCVSSSQVLVFIINGLIFFYVGAASVNFTWRATNTLFHEKSQGVQLVLIMFYKLPLIYLFSFGMRFVFVATS